MVVTRVTVFSLLESLKCQNAPYLTFYLWFKQHTNVGATTRKYEKHLFKLQQAYLISALVMEQPGLPEMKTVHHSSIRPDLSHRLHRLRLHLRRRCVHQQTHTH